MGRIHGARFDRYCIVEVMCLCTLLQIYIHVQGQDNFFLHGPLLHALDGKGTGRGFACVFALCLILYLGWEHVFGGMVLLINILYTLYCTSTRCESTRWVEELSECFSSIVYLFFLSLVFYSVSAKKSELCTYTMAEKSEPGYGLLYCWGAVQRDLRSHFIRKYAL